MPLIQSCASGGRNLDTQQKCADGRLCGRCSHSRHGEEPCSGSPHCELLRRTRTRRQKVLSSWTKKGKGHSESPGQGRFFLRGARKKFLEKKPKIGTLTHQLSGVRHLLVLRHSRRLYWTEAICQHRSELQYLPSLYTPPRLKTF
jgi:hypothetical protein